MILSAVVGTALRAMGQPRQQSASNYGGVETALDASKYIKMADDTTTQASSRQKYTSSVKPRPDYSYVNIINQKYREALASLSDVQTAAKNQAIRQNLDPFVIKKIDYDFTFSDRDEGERTSVATL
tara:strand:+ start:37 stop:414 length:378 start_codon:yes stop_codon:yes gene_type:complete